MTTFFLNISRKGFYNLNMANQFLLYKGNDIRTWLPVPQATNMSLWRQKLLNTKFPLYFMYTGNFGASGFGGMAEMGLFCL